MIRLFALLAVLALPLPAHAITLSKSYAYYSIHGRTLEDIDKELQKHGPQLHGEGARHPGATRMEFNTKISYGEKNGRCRVANAHVILKVRMTLPRWRQRRHADPDTRLIWDTLSADIKRHEESHVVIAKNHARELENALNAIYPKKDCDLVAAKAKEVTQQILAKHDRAQDEFDRIEGINFESRIMRLLRYRMQQIEEGRIPG